LHEHLLDTTKARKKYFYIVFLNLKKNLLTLFLLQHHGLIKPKYLQGSLWQNYSRDGILKLLRSPGIDSKEAIPPAHVAWRAGPTTIFIVPARQATRLGESIPGLLERFQIRT
jgi:hypothetical protein